MFDVIGIGENSVDHVVLVPSFPHPEGWRSKMALAGRRISCGGRVATTLGGCVKLGLRAKYVGTRGCDEHGERLATALAAAGVNITDLLVRDASNRAATILVAADSGERAVLWERHPALRLQPAEVPLDSIRRARLLHLDDEDEEASLTAARAAVAAGIPITTDLDRATDLARELLRLATFPIVTEGLLSELTGVADVERALRMLRREHDGLLCVTRGRRGAAALEGDRYLEVPGFPVNAVDTTGAGDIFRSGFIYGVLQEWPVERLLRFANAAAAASCCREGALDAAPTLGEISRLLDEA